MLARRADDGDQIDQLLVRDCLPVSTLSLLHVGNYVVDGLR